MCAKLSKLWSRKESEEAVANIVIFGETGVGKSSVINPIAGQALAHTSNNAVRCTIRHQRYPIMLGNISCALWDTVGLDEGCGERVPAKEAEDRLKDIIDVLSRSGGTHLVIYCIRGTRLTEALKRNYELFYVTACRRKVPVALVVTGLEYEEEMESWWVENEGELRRNEMWFDAHACVTTLDVEDDFIQQRRSQSQAMLRELVVAYSQQVEPEVDANIVIFGETGIGKSVINLIANQAIAHTSNDAVGCTFRYQRYSVKLGDVSCALWDTAGLYEGSEGTVPAKEAEDNLKDLIELLARSGGIHLVIYCIRGTRLTKALKRNYELFYVTACRKKAPVALVVTGLEYQEEEMESWWTENDGELRRNRMWFDAHACVTTLNVDDRSIQQRRSDSRTMLCELVVKYSELPGWKTDSSVLQLVLPLFHTAFRGKASAGRTGNAAAVRKVIICGPSPRFFSGEDTGCDKTTTTIGARQYELRRVDKEALTTIQPEACAGVGLLVFYSSALVENQIPRTDIDALKEFYDVGGGQSRPVIVVLQGCDDDQVARTCQVDVASMDIQAHFISVPSSSDTGERLDEMIDILCMDQDHVKVPRK